MGWRNKLLLWIILLGVGFLIGFLLQYRELAQARSARQTADAALADCTERRELAHIRELIVRTYLAAMEKNYGIASQYARQLFDEIQQVARKALSPAVSNALGELTKNRDAIMASLAQGDPAVLTQLHTLYAQALEKIKE